MKIMKCNICEYEEFMEIFQSDTIFSSGHDGMGRSFQGSSTNLEKLKGKYNRKIGNTIVEFKENIEIFACLKCGNIQICKPD